MNAVEGYLSKLPAERRDALARVRDTINARLPPGYEERIQYGMISWCVPEAVLPADQTYNKQPLGLVGLASQKNYMVIYLMAVYGDPRERAWFEAAYKQSGKKLDMGQSCVRFKSLDALPLDVIGEAVSHVTVEDYVGRYRAIQAGRKPAKRPARKPAKRAAGASKPASRAGSSRKPARSPAKSSNAPSKRRRR